MNRFHFPVIALLITTLLSTGCKKKEECAPGDTPAECKAVQECFASGTSVAACREAEKDAIRYDKHAILVFCGRREIDQETTPTCFLTFFCLFLAGVNVYYALQKLISDSHPALQSSFKVLSPSQLRRKHNPAAQTCVTHPARRLG